MAIAWRLASSLDVLRKQIDKGAPNRSKKSDGTIGDARHQKIKSDHNPNSSGVVCALDITHDVVNGCDAHLIGRTIAGYMDPRLGYVISNRMIYDAQSPKGRNYTGKNPHTMHCHISVHKNVDSAVPWKIDHLFGSKPPEAVSPIPAALRRPLLKLGSKGADVLKLQNLLRELNLYSGPMDGKFGPKTKAAVVNFQRSRRLEDDGKVGPYTWAALDPKADEPRVIIPPPRPPAAVPEPVKFQPRHFPLVSAYGEAWCETFELFMAEPYDDRGTLAQGFGHNEASGIPPIPIKGGDPWTLDYAREVMRTDLKIQVHYLNTYVKVPLTQAQVDCFALDIFQMGPGNWKKDKVLECLNAGDFEGAFNAMRDRKDISGLDRRRHIQAAIGSGKNPDVSLWNLRGTAFYNALK